jgi:pimeloyl-ACP methyl ester carboxylesterase
MKRTTIQGVEIAYRTAGSRARGTLLLLHGFTGNSRNWMLNVDALAAAGWHTVSPDHPGHGQSSAPEDPAVYRMEALADTHHALAATLGELPVVVVGHSMGGAVAEELVIRHGRDVAALVLADSAGGSHKESWVKALAAYGSENRRRVARERGMTGLYDYQVEKGYRNVDHIPEHLREFVRSEFSLTSPTGYFHCAAAMRDRTDTLDRLAGFDKPTLIVQGENEDADFTAASRELHETIRGSIYRVIEDATHFPQFEAAERFNAVLLEFLGSLDS